MPRYYVDDKDTLKGYLEHTDLKEKDIKLVYISQPLEDNHGLIHLQRCSSPEGYRAVLENKKKMWGVE